MPVVLLVLIGAVAGYLASRLMRISVDMPTAMVIGVIGAVVGGVGLRLLLASAGWVVLLVVATLASMGLLWLWEKYGPRR